MMRVLDSMYDGVIVIGPDTRILYVNPAYTRILGVRAEKILGRLLSEVEPAARILDVVRTGKPVVNEYVTIQSLGIEVVVNITPVFKGSALQGAVSIFRNVTDVMRLNEALERMKGLARYLQEELEKKDHLPGAFHDLVGKNPRFCKALHRAALVARTEATVLIRGESGVGKELLARAIHLSSHRKGKPFVAVNCAAVPEALLESELFGYEEGAFTGARRSGKIGKLELAHEGTLFLDEVGDMSLAMQAKLLRALQQKEIERIGGSKGIPVDIRVIAATNKDLESMIKSGSFREDLYYRLSVVPIFLPPLRERKDDLVLLANCFLDEFSRQYHKNLTLSEEAVAALYQYNWPGNVRELRNAIEHGVVLCTGDTILRSHLPRHVTFSGGGSDIVPGDLFAQGLSLEELLKKVEKQALLQALELCGQNRTRAMRMLGLSRSTFYSKLAEHGLRGKSPRV